jgi:GNAT superfamily N-acetyltransferase
VHISLGQPGDHALVYALLRSLNQAPRHEDFLSGLDEPGYEPCDRLLLKFNRTLVGHVQVLHRAAWFHGVKLPIAGLADFAVLPEWQRTGHPQLIIAAAEEAMRKSGSILGIAETTRQDHFESNNWRPTSAHGHSQINVQELLAYLTAHPHSLSRDSINPDCGRRMAKGEQLLPSIHARPWRQMERRQIRAIYDAFAANCWGAIARSDSYWHWLVGRKNGCELVVTAHGPPDDEPEHESTQIVGYAVVHAGQILEVATLGDEPRARTELLIHACHNAIECGHRTIELHIPISDPLHELVITAGGSWCGVQPGGRCLVAKLLDPSRWVEAIFPILRHRARAARLALPLELVIDVDDARFRLTITRRGSRLSPIDGVRADMHCPRAEWDQLLIGNYDRTPTSPLDQSSFRDQETRKITAALFPPVLFWQSPFDSSRT